MQFPNQSLIKVSSIIFGWHSHSKIFYSYSLVFEVYLTQLQHTTMSIMELCMKELMMQQKLGQEYHFQQQQQQQNFKYSNSSTAIPLPPTPTPSIGPYLIPSSFTVSPIGPFDYAAHQWQQQQQGHNFQPFERKSTFMQVGYKKKMNMLQ